MSHRLKNIRMWTIHGWVVVCLLYSTFRLTWKRAEESILKPSDPGCLTRGKAPGSSTARKALKATLPNARAWVSGWALSWSERKEYYSFEWTQTTCDMMRDFFFFLCLQWSWICRVVMGRQPDSQTQSCWGCIWGHIHQLRYTGRLSLCYKWMSRPSSALDPPSLDHKLYPLRE